MAISQSSVKAGDAYIALGLQDKTQGDMSAIAAKWDKMANVGIRIGAIGAAVFTATTVALNVMTTEAGNYEATLFRLKAIYKDLYTAQEAWMQTFATGAQRSQSQIAKSLATFGAFAKGLGFATDEASTLSRALVNVTSNLATFHNLAYDEGSQRIIAALSGSAEVLDQLGINIKAAAVDQQLLAMGFRTSAQGATEQQKTLARTITIMQSMVAQGSDLADSTFKTLPRAYAAMKAAISDFLVAGGTPYLKMLSAAVGLVTSLIKGGTKLFRTFPLLTQVVGVATLALSGLVATTLILSLAVKGVTYVLTTASAAGALWSTMTYRMSAHNMALATTFNAVGASAKVAIIPLAKILGLLAIIGAEGYVIGKGLSEIGVGGRMGGFEASLSNIATSWKQSWQDVFYDIGQMFKVFYLGLEVSAAVSMAVVFDMMYKGFLQTLQQMQMALLGSPLLILMEKYSKYLGGGGVVAQMASADLKKGIASLQTQIEAIESGENSFLNPTHWLGENIKEMRDDLKAVEQEQVQRYKTRKAKEERDAANTFKEDMARIKELGDAYGTTTGRGGSVITPRALEYRTVAGQHGAYQTQKGMLDYFQKMIGINTLNLEANQSSLEETRRFNAAGVAIGVE